MLSILPNQTVSIEKSLIKLNLYSILPSLHHILVNLVDKDKLEMLDQLRSTVNAEKAEVERRLQHLEAEMKSKEEQLRMNVSQINSLLTSTVDLQNDSIGQRDVALQREEDLKALRAKLYNSDMPSEAQDVLLLKETELKTSQEKLQKARTFIRQQDKIIQELKTKSSITPEEVLKASRRIELENATLRQEQRLMMSTFYEMQQRLNREQMMSGTFWKNGSNRAQTKAGVRMMGNKPKSWLQQQRNELAGGISLARR